MEKFWLLGHTSLGGCLHMQISNESFSKAKLCNGCLVICTLNQQSKSLDKFNQPVRELTWP